MFDTVALGLGAEGRLLTDYHHAIGMLEHSGDDTRRLALVDSLQARLDASGGWTLGHRVDTMLSRARVAPDRRVGDAFRWLAEARRAGAGAGGGCPTCCCSTSRPTTWTSPPSRGSSSLLLDFDGAVVCVTHDRRFLDTVATRIVELDRGRLL